MCLEALTASVLPWWQRGDGQAGPEDPVSVASSVVAEICPAGDDVEPRLSLADIDDAQSNLCPRHCTDPEAS